MHSPYCLEENCGLSIDSTDWFFNHFGCNRRKMTEQELKEIESRANAATEGPWVLKIEDATASFGMFHSVYSGKETICDNLPYYPTGVFPYNQDFIAHARTDVPALIAEVRKLQRALEKCKEQRDGWMDDVGVAREVRDKEIALQDAELDAILGEK